MKTTTIFVLGILFLLVFAGCTIPEISTQGSLRLTINNGINSKTLVPDLDIEPASYRIIGAGPEGAAFDENTTNGDVTIGFLRFGEWTINIEAFNAEGTLIATGSANATVHVEDVTNVPVTIRLLDGTGRFNLGVSWSTNEIENPKITGVLKSSSGSDINLTFFDAEGDMGTQNVFADTGNTVPVGYYTLAVKVNDLGASGTADHLALGAIEVVRILKNETTYGDYYLQGVPGMGKIDVNIEQDFNDPIEVSLESIPFMEELPTTAVYDSGAYLDLKAVVPAADEDAGNITFIWYLNGESVSVDDNYSIQLDNSPLSTTINGKYAPGHYRLDVTAFNTDGSRAGSTSYEFDVTGNPGQIVTEPEPSTIILTASAMSSSGSYGVYSYSASPDSSEGYRKSFDIPGSSRHLAWSPDKKKVAYVSDADGTNDIYVIDTDNNNIVQITNDDFNATYLEWSSDGSAIAYAAEGLQGPSTHDIYVVSADGSGVPQNVTNSSTYDMHPTWSPDGLKLAFHSMNSSSPTSSLFVINVDGSSREALLDVTGQNDGFARWSPDGSKVLFVSTRAGSYDLYSIEVAAKTELRITDVGGMTNYHGWSPEGDRVVYLNDYQELILVDADGSGNTEIITGIAPGYISSLQWE